MRKLFGFLFVLACSVALAQTASTNGTSTAHLSWTAPTTYSNGTALVSTDIAFYTVLETAGGSTFAIAQVNAPAITATVAGVCGTVSFTVTLTTTASARYPSTTSLPTSPVTFVSSTAGCVPSAPAGLKVS